MFFFFFFKQKTAYEIYQCDWSSDVCSSDLYTADVATNGQEAIAAVERRSYDLVLMDVLMPVLDGLEATRRIRARDKGKQPVILAMTANVLETDQQVCLQAGMDDYLSKPVTTAAVRAKLIELFGQEEQAG